MNTALERVLVLGGTGFVGRSVCERLAEAHPAGRIVVPTRRLQTGARVRTLPTLELVQANVHDGATLARLMAGCSAVVNLVAILHGSRAEFERVHVELPRKIAAACRAAGVRRLVHVSALGVGPEGPSNYLQTKTAGEAVLQAAGLDLTVLRPSVIFGAEDSFMNLFAQLQGLAPFVPLAGSDTRFQPVWVEDVAAAVVACLQQPATAGQVVECAGPDVFTLSQLVQLAGRWAGHARAQIPLPMALGRLQALAMEWLPGTPLMSRDNLLSMQVPNVASGKLPGLAALGITPAALEAVGPAYLSRGQGCARLEAWRALARRD